MRSYQRPSYNISDRPLQRNTETTMGNKDTNPTNSNSITNPKISYILQMNNILSECAELLSSENKMSDLQKVLALHYTCKKHNGKLLTPPYTTAPTPIKTNGESGSSLEWNPVCSNVNLFHNGAKFYYNNNVPNNDKSKFHTIEDPDCSNTLGVPGNIFFQIYSKSDYSDKYSSWLSKATDNKEPFDPFSVKKNSWAEPAQRNIQHMVSTCLYATWVKSLLSTKIQFDRCKANSITYNIDPHFYNWRYNEPKDEFDVARLEIIRQLNNDPNEKQRIEELARNTST